MPLRIPRYTPLQGACIAGVLVFAYELQSEGRDGQIKPYRKPWALTAAVFFAQLLCLPLALYLEWRKPREVEQTAGKEQPHEDKLKVTGDSSSSKDATPATANGGWRSWLRVWGLVMFPTLLSIVGMALLSIALLNVTVSVWQMLRGLEVLFAAVLGVLFLGRRLNGFHRTGVALTVVGVAVVGLSYVLSGGASPEHTTTAQMLLGLGLGVASLALQAATLTVEEHLMRREAISGAMLMALQGAIGSVILVGVILPVVYYLPGKEGEGIHEDTLDTLVMLSNSPALLAVVVLDVVMLVPYQLVAMAVTYDQGAVFLTIMDSLKTVVVWGVMLVLFYAGAAGGTLGEKWSNWSWMQVGGFVVIITAAFVYGHGDTLEADKEKLETEGLQGPQQGSSCSSSSAAAGKDADVEAGLQPESDSTPPCEGNDGDEQQLALGDAVVRITAVRGPLEE